MDSQSTLLFDALDDKGVAKMATHSEAVGITVAAQAMSNAALAMLVKLGHKDLLDQIKETALATLNRSITDDIEGIDAGAALQAGRMALMSQVESAKAAGYPPSTN